MGKSKLTEQDRKDIRKLADEGYSSAALAAKYGVSYTTIHRVLNPDYYAKGLARAIEYQKENYPAVHNRDSLNRRVYRFSFNREKDERIISQLDKQDNIHDYIRRLVIADIEKNQG